MSTLLRKVKSTISAATLDPRSDADLQDKFVTRGRLQRAQLEWRSETFADHSLNLNAPVVCQNQPDSYVQHQHHPLTEFRRRLARKASTFSLRTKRRKAELKEQEQEVKKKDKGSGSDTLVHQGQDDSLRSIKEKLVNPPVEEPGRRQQPVLQGGSDGESNRTSDTNLVQLRESSGSHTEADSTIPVVPSQDFLIPQTVQDFIRKEQEGYLCLNYEGGKTLAKMASEHTAAPPVPYTRLKEITESACETALAGVKAYSHADTESWNTTIINSILGALVEETTQKSASGSTPAQPQYKYVVNSTIIQHAAAPASSSDDTKKAGGRRGMHAASGAYWNNEKDGMWSYKYPGADSKGLDVVVGIIWIWVG